MIKHFFRKIVFLILITLFSQLLCEQQRFCEKDEKTGPCKVDEFYDEKDDGPCWIQEESSKKYVEQKLIRLNGVKVCYWFSCLIW